MNWLKIAFLGLVTVNFGYIQPLMAVPTTSLWRSPVKSLWQTHDHLLNGANCRTVYLRGIPVISFVGDGGMANVYRFTALVEQAVAEQWDAESIEPLWENGRFAIRFNPQVVWQLDESMTFPETTGDRQQDVLLITNRLRRSLGAVQPVATIANLPSNSAPAPNLVAQVIRVVRVLTGLASWYGPGFHGNRSASGEIFNQNALTAAHPTLPFGTNVRVTNMLNGQSVVVRINDRGPFKPNRVIDISRAAAQRIGLISAGVAPVKLEVLATPE